MAIWQGPLRWVLILLVIGLVGIGTAVLAFRPTLGGMDAETVVQVKATVVASASCGDQGAHDTVEVKEDGGLKQVPLDGCGHAKGQVVDVVLGKDSSGQPIAQPAANTGLGADKHGRLATVLLILSALAGSLYVFLIRRQDWSILLARLTARWNQET